MDFNFTEEQVMLRDNLQAMLKNRYPFAARRDASKADPGWQPEIWKYFAVDLGLLSAGVAEEAGGMGGNAVDQMVIMEELGRALVLEPYIECAVAASSILQNSAGEMAAQALGGIMDGSEIIVPAFYEPTSRFGLQDVQTKAARSGDGWLLDGTKAVVTAAPWASRLIVSARTGDGANGSADISMFLVDPAISGVSLQSYPTIDGRRAADITMSGVALPSDALIGPEHRALPLMEEAIDRAIAALCAEAVGVMSYMLEATIEYTAQRHQFGQPISSFQVLQHRMVDMYMQIELARSAMYLANLTIDGDVDERAEAVSAAKVTIANACRFVGQNAIQLHGGMGMTEELAVTHYFKRATVIEHEFGTADFHTARFSGLTMPPAHVAA